MAVYLMTIDSGESSKNHPLFISFSNIQEAILKRLTSSILIIALLSFFSGCASMSSTKKGAAIGTTAGAVIGGIIGKQTGNTAAGAIIGAAIGGSAGA